LRANAALFSNWIDAAIAQAPQRDRAGDRAWQARSWEGPEFLARQSWRPRECVVEWLRLQPEKALTVLRCYAVDRGGSPGLSFEFLKDD